MRAAALNFSSVSLAVIDLARDQDQDQDMIRALTLTTGGYVTGPLTRLPPKSVNVQFVKTFLPVVTC